MMERDAARMRAGWVVAGPRPGQGRPRGPRHAWRGVAEGGSAKSSPSSCRARSANCPLLRGLLYLLPRMAGADGGVVDVMAFAITAVAYRGTGLDAGTISALRHHLCLCAARTPFRREPFAALRGSVSRASELCCARIVADLVQCVTSTGPHSQCRSMRSGVVSSRTHWALPIYLAKTSRACKNKAVPVELGCTGA